MDNKARANGTQLGSDNCEDYTHQKNDQNQAPGKRQLCTMDQAKSNGGSHYGHNSAEPPRHNWIQEASEVQFFHERPQADRKHAGHQRGQWSLQELFHWDMFRKAKKTLEELQRNQDHP